MNKILSKPKKGFSRKTIGSHPILSAVRPDEGYVFCSDYFKLDNGGTVGCVLAFTHIAGAEDRFAPFWGVHMLPRNLPDGVTAIKFEQICRMSDTQLSDLEKKAEDSIAIESVESKGTVRHKHKLSKSARDLQVITVEISNGATYLTVMFRLLLKAPDIESLDTAIVRIQSQYTDWYQTLQAAALHGEQRRELSTLLSPNSKKSGKPFGLTSTEYAGAYSLVTRGIIDKTGEYIGVMSGDYNSSAVLLDIDGFKRHVVICSEEKSYLNKQERASCMWGSKLGQAALLNGRRVVHMILDGSNLSNMGPKFASITSNLNMNQGDVNMFEMFGEQDDELAIFASQMDKLTLMAEHAYPATDHDRSIIRGSFKDIVSQFYVDNRMWAENAQSNRDVLRVVGIPHNEVPRLRMFVAYLEQKRKELTNAGARDDEELHAFSVLRAAFLDLLQTNGDLFDVHTSGKINKVSGAPRAVYDFSGLRERDSSLGVMMAQFVNILGFACGHLSDGDLLLIHGAEIMSESVRDYVGAKLGALMDRGGRVAFLYNSMPKVLDDKPFSRFDKADYTIFGGMTQTMVNDYKKSLGYDMPPDLEAALITRDSRVFYVHRDFDNVVFHCDLDLGM